MIWPEYFPQNCPPDDAEPATGVAYRLIRSTKPKKNDFKPYNSSGSFENNGKACLASGLSVYKNLDDVYKMQARVGAKVPAIRKRVIAEGVLTPDMGKIKHSPSFELSHYTWWIPLGVEPWTRFMVMLKSGN